jgi:hypothetical protein
MIDQASRPVGHLTRAELLREIGLSPQWQLRPQPSSRGDAADVTRVCQAITPAESAS